jgi:hypothetical protein
MSTSSREREHQSMRKDSRQFFSWRLGFEATGSLVPEMGRALLFSPARLSIELLYDTTHTVYQPSSSTPFVSSLPPSLPSTTLSLPPPSTQLPRTFFPQLYLPCSCRHKFNSASSLRLLPSQHITSHYISPSLKLTYLQP